MRHLQSATVGDTHLDRFLPKLPGDSNPAVRQRTGMQHRVADQLGNDGGDIVQDLGSDPTGEISAHLAASQSGTAGVMGHNDTRSALTNPRAGCHSAPIHFRYFQATFRQNTPFAQPTSVDCPKFCR